VRVNKVGKAATALLMVAIAVEIFRPGVPGELLFYIGIVSRSSRAPLRALRPKQHPMTVA
jgi:hypothetical protein